MLRGRQELSLRGHRDQDPLALEQPIEDPSNLQALVQIALYYRIPI